MALVLLHSGLPIKCSLHPSSPHQLPAVLRKEGSSWPSPGIMKDRIHIASNRCRTTLPFLQCSLAQNGSTTVVDKPTVIPADVVIGRSSFPPRFTFGAASSAYQVEGAWNEGGRGPSIWDTFTHERPDKIVGGSNGDVATDSYHRYSEDIKIMKDMGVDSYRFSISWSRILPDGTLEGGINQEGIAYYNNLINEIIKNGLTPCVTLFHWDVPQALEEKYGGFRDKRIIKDFKDFANTCFEAFGPRVKNWITLNEPWTLSSLGYSLGWHAPGRCTQRDECPAGDSLEEPYIVSHNLILAHAAAAQLYKQKYQASHKGEVGITLVGKWFKPYSDSYQDKAAADRAMEFLLGWYMVPLLTGDYPFNMRAVVKERLPYFTEEESKMIIGSYDFIGLNYYTTNYAKAIPFTEANKPTISIMDTYAELLGEKDGVPIGDLHGSWVYVVPDGLTELLFYMKEQYNNPKIYITENGTYEFNNPELPLEEALDDPHRIEYLKLHLAEVQAAIKEGVRVRGYFAWSVTDNFEWHEGYHGRFGLTYIDFNDNLKRHTKASTAWYTEFLKT